MNIIRRPSFNGALPALVAMLAAFVAISPAVAQDTTANETFTGTVVSSTRNTLVVRNTAGQHQLFTLESDTTRPTSIAAGSRVRVVSVASDELGVRVARDVAVLQPGGAGASRDANAASASSNTGAGANAGSTAEVDPVVPRELRTIERDIERQARRFQVGVRAGVALDPELVMIGVQSQIGPFFSPDLYIRPSVDFGFGEVTALFALNLEAIYRLPLNARQSRWSAYAGAGPGFNFIHQNFDRTSGTKRVDFGEFHSDTALNILGGIRFRRGTFAELRTSVYSKEAPTLRLSFGYNF